MNRIKILVLSHSAANGGAELALKSLIESTSSIFDWSIIYPTASRKTSLKINGLSKSYYIALPWWCYEGNDIPAVDKRQLRNNIHSIKRIAKEYDLLLTNTLTIPWLAYISSEIQKPHAWYVHEYGNADHKLNFILGYDESLRMIASKSTKIMTISNNLKEHLSKIILPENIAIIHQAVDLGTYTNIPTKRYNKAPTIDDIKIATIAALRPSKGQHLLIDAVYNLQKKGYKTPRIIIRGPNADPRYVDYLNKVNKKVNDVDVEVGFVSPAEVLSSADVVFVGSDNEALGRGTLEGLASGRLVLGSNTGATTDLLAEGRGILFDINNKKSLESAILGLPKALLENKPKLSRKFVIDNYSPDVQKIDFMNVVESLSINTASHADINNHSAHDLADMYDDIKKRTTVKNIMLRVLSKVRKFIK